MAIDYAKFTAELAKGIKIGSDVEVKLLIPLKSAVPFLEFLSNSQGEDVLVHIGDPQASFDFGDDEQDDMYKTWTGRQVTTDQSGVVTSVKKTGEGPEEEHDENQAELPLGGDSTGDGNPPAGNETSGSDKASEDETPGQEAAGDEGDSKPSADDDIPEWMREEGAVSGSDPKEMDFEEEGAGDDQQAGQTDQEQGSETSPADVDKETLEQYIIENRPVFDDMTNDIDFPSLIERKRTSDVTWRELAKEVGMPSSQLTGKLNKYKERVKQQMAGSGVA